MSSWRDTTSQTVQDDLDQLVGIGIEAAQGLIAKRGEFFPFGVRITSDGEAGLSAAGSELGDQPESLAVLEALYVGAFEAREGLRGAAFVADVRASGGDVIRVQAEHRDGGPGIEVQLPYARKRFRKEVEYGRVSAGAAPRRVWPRE